MTFEFFITSLNVLRFSDDMRCKGKKINIFEQNFW